jgi:cytochrome c553
MNFLKRKFSLVLVLMLFLFILVFTSANGVSDTSVNSINNKNDGESDTSVNSINSRNDGCFNCHSGFKVGSENTQNNTIDELKATITTLINAENSPMYSLKSQLSERDIENVSSYLLSGKHSQNWSDEDNHGNFVEHSSVNLQSCKQCHGDDLRGENKATSCFTCHNEKWD